MRYLALLAVLIGGIATASCGPQHSTTSPGACRSPITTGDYDPQPRDVHLQVTGNSVAWTLCIVSNASKPYQQISADVAVFNVNGTYMGHQAAGVQFTYPDANSLPGVPKFIISPNQAVGVDPKDLAAGLSNSVVVTLAWIACTGTTEATCAPAAQEFRGFNASAEVQ
jgi:hypothetical protein